MSRRPSSSPRSGEEPLTVARFAVALSLTAAYLAFAVYASTPWRSELREALSPVMAWAIPTTLAYIPAVLVGFMVFTLITLRYRVPPAEPPSGSWPQGKWPPVAILIAARDEERAIAAVVERIAQLSYTGPIEVVLADNGSGRPHRRAGRGGGASRRAGLPSCLRARGGQVPGAEHGSRGCEHPGRGHRRRRHAPAPSGAQVSDLPAL